MRNAVTPKRMLAKKPKQKPVEYPKLTNAGTSEGVRKAWESRHAASAVIGKTVSGYNQKRVLEAFDKIKAAGLIVPQKVHIEQMSTPGNQAHYKPARTLKTNLGDLNLPAQITIGNKMTGGVRTIIHEYGHHADNVLGGGAYHSAEASKPFLPQMDDGGRKEEFADNFQRQVTLGDSKKWGMFAPHYPALTQDQHSSYYGWHDAAMQKN